MMVGVGVETRSRMMVADVRGWGTGVRVLEAGGGGPVVLLVVEGDGELTVDNGESGCLGLDGDVEPSGSVVEGGGEGGEEFFGDDGGVVETLESVVMGREDSPGGDVGSVGLGVEAKEVPAAPLGLGTA